jgi:hypothetical protein
MGLSMGEKISVSRETAGRYRKASRKGKRRILDEFTQTTGCHRKYAIYLLSNWGKQKLRVVNGKPVRFVIGKRPKPKNATLTACIQKLSGRLCVSCGAFRLHVRQEVGCADSYERRTSCQPG